MTLRRLELYELRLLELHRLGLKRLELHLLELRLRLSQLLLSLLKLGRLGLLLNLLMLLLNLLQLRMRRKLNILNWNLDASVALRHAVIERRHEERRMRIARVGLLFSLRGTDVGHVKLLTSRRLGVVGRCQKHVIGTIRARLHLLQIQQKSPDVDKLLRFQWVLITHDQRNLVSRFHVNRRFVLKVVGTGSLKGSVLAPRGC